MLFNIVMVIPLIVIVTPAAEADLLTMVIHVAIAPVKAGTVYAVVSVFGTLSLSYNGF